MKEHEQQTSRLEKISNFFGGNNFSKLNNYKQRFRINSHKKELIPIYGNNFWGQLFTITFPLFVAILLFAATGALATENILKNTVISRDNGWSYWMHPEYKESGTTVSFHSGNFSAKTRKQKDFKSSRLYLQLAREVNELERGKTYKVSFRLQSDKPGNIRVAYIEANPPYSSMAEVDMSISVGKQYYECIIRPELVDGKYPEQRSLRFFVGSLINASISISDIEIKEALPDGALKELNIDFSNIGKPVHKKDKGVFSGGLPHGVSEDFPAWNTSEVKTEKCMEDGREFLRFKVDKINNAVLFRLSDKKLEVPGFYNLTVDLRCHNEAPNFHMRQRPFP